MPLWKTWTVAERTLALEKSTRIDHFKDYNDTYGHQAGDLCLPQETRDGAEALLYRARHTGRDRYCASQGP